MFVSVGWFELTYSNVTYLFVSSRPFLSDLLYVTIVFSHFVHILSYNLVGILVKSILPKNISKDSLP